MKKRFLCIFLVVILALSMVSCNKKENVKTQSNLEKGVVSYPIETEETLTYWCELPAQISTEVTNLGDTPFAKNLNEATGIDIKYMHPAQGQGNEVLRLMIASGELPDIIQANWLAQGPSNCIEQNIILNLNDYIKDYAPNLSEFLKENSDVKKMIKTDEGDYYVFPFIRNDDVLLVSTGLMLRSDWLKEAGLDVPETIEEWDTVLAAFKEKCDTPFAMNNYGLFASGFGTFNGSYVDNGEMIFGPIEDGFKDLVVKLNEWYKKGYIDKNFAIADSKIIKSNILNGISGITYGAGGSGMGVYLTEKTNDTFDIAAAPFPVEKKGDKAKFSTKELKYSIGGAAITSACKNPELAARFLDYGYSDEGHMFYNFGKEGESYNLENGYPKYAQSITDTSDGKSMSQKLTMNCMAGVYGPFVQDKRYIEQYYSTPQQQDAIKKWSDNTFEKHRVPQIIMTMDELNEHSSIMSEINTYVAESFNNFIIGAEPIDNFEKYVKTVKSMGIDRALEIQQIAYERYLDR